MYTYIEDKTFLKEMKRCCSDIINQLVQSINNDSVMIVEAHLVGSGARNLITQNARQPVDLDYNLCIAETTGDFSINDGRMIKEYIRKQFNIILNRNGWADCSDSTSALTTEERYFPKLKNHTAFKIDLAIVKRDCYGWHRLRHHKTGFASCDQWYWNLTKNSDDLEDKIEKLKRNNLWEEVRETYLYKKNEYLKRNDSEHPSFIVYIETVNEIYYKFFQQQKGGLLWF